MSSSATTLMRDRAWCAASSPSIVRIVTSTPSSRYLIASPWALVSKWMSLASDFSASWIVESTSRTIGLSAALMDSDRDRQRTRRLRHRPSRSSARLRRAPAANARRPRERPAGRPPSQKAQVRRPDGSASRIRCAAQARVCVSSGSDSASSVRSSRRSATQQSLRWPRRSSPGRSPACSRAAAPSRATRGRSARRRAARTARSARPAIAPASRSPAAADWRAPAPRARGLRSAARLRGRRSVICLLRTRRYCRPAASSKIGMYISTTMPPMTRPMTDHQRRFDQARATSTARSR